MREHERDRSLNAIEDLYAARRVDAQQFSDIWNKLPSAPILKHTTQVPNEPVQGMFVVDPVDSAWCFYLGTEWICIRHNPLSHAIKVFSDRKSNSVSNGAFRFVIDPLLDGTDLIFAGIFNGTPGAGVTTVQVSNQTRGIDLLSTPCTITSGGLYGFNSVVSVGGSTQFP